MLRWSPALFLAACSGSGLTYDNEDALGEIPPAEAPVDRDDIAESPYDPPAPGENDGTPDDPPPDPPEDPIDPPDDPTDPPDDDPPDDPPDDDPPDTTGDDCPAGLICVDQFPHIESNTTTGGAAQLDGYACAPGTNEAGPERVYRVEIAEPGFLAVTLWGMPAGVDIDAHLLGSLDAGDCIDRGHWDAAALLQPGTYYLVADSWTDGSGVPQDGDYSVRFHFTGLDAYAGDGLTTAVMDHALTAFDRAWRDGETSKLVYTVADFSMPSTQRRLWTFDLATGDLLFNEFVTHGEGSGDPNDITMVGAMSNTNGSHMSSVGLMRAAETYYGSKGYSMRLDGLEGGFNDAVRPRAIVFHEADYATQAFVNANGYLGRSWGCPAVDPAVSAALIDTIKNGGLFLSYFDDSSWLSTSDYL